MVPARRDYRRAGARQESGPARPCSGHRPAYLPGRQCVSWGNTKLDNINGAALAIRATENLGLMDGSTIPVRRIIAKSELVFGVWQDSAEPDGIGWLIIKGQ